MPRFNPLTNTLETPAEKPRRAPRKPAVTKAEPGEKPTAKIAARVPQISTTALSLHVGRIATATIAALLDGADKRTAERKRAEFAAWCAARPHLSDWRAAWRLFAAAPETPVAETPVAETPAPSVAHVAQIAPVAPRSPLTPAEEPSAARRFLAALS